MGAATSRLANTGGTDHLSFDAVGLPGFQFIQDPIEYDTRTHHSNKDVFDRIQADDLKQAAVIMAAFVYNAAMRDEKLPRKPSRERSEVSRAQEEMPCRGRTERPDRKTPSIPPRRSSRHSSRSRLIQVDPHRAGRAARSSPGVRRVPSGSSETRIRSRCSGRTNPSATAWSSRREQRVEVAVDVEQADRLAVQAERGPGQDLEELLVRADAAGQGEEPPSAAGHQGLALVHAGDDVQLGQPVVGDLLGRPAARG